MNIMNNKYRELSLEEVVDLADKRGIKINFNKDFRDMESKTLKGIIVKALLKYDRENTER